MAYSRPGFCRVARQFKQLLVCCGESYGIINGPTIFGSLFSGSQEYLFSFNPMSNIALDALLLDAVVCYYSLRAWKLSCKWFWEPRENALKIAVRLWLCDHCGVYRKLCFSGVSWRDHQWPNSWLPLLWISDFHSQRGQCRPNSNGFVTFSNHTNRVIDNCRSSVSFWLDCFFIILALSDSG